MKNIKNPIQKRVKLSDEETQIFVAKEVSTLVKKCQDVGIDEDYTAYLTFCIIGSVILKNDPQDFHKYVEEIKHKNQKAS